MIRAMKLGYFRSFFYLVVNQTPTTNQCLLVERKGGEIVTNYVVCGEIAFGTYRYATVEEILEDFTVEELMAAARSKRS